MRLPFLLSAIVALGPALATPAEPNPFCGTQLPLERLAGDYILSVGGGVLPAEGQIVPVGVAATYGIPIEARDDHLVMTLGAEQITLRPAGEPAPATPFAAGIATAYMTRPVFEQAVGCQIEHLPRLVGQHEALTFELIVHAPGAMVGTLSSADDAPGAGQVLHLDRQS